MDFSLRETCIDVPTYSSWLFAGCAHQVRTHEHLGLCMQARLHDGQRKTHMPSGKRLAPDADAADALRQRINRAYLRSWSDDAVRRRLYRVVASAIDAAALIIDDTGFEKKGDKSPGVQRQYTGTAGKVTNCQVVVSTHLASHDASAPLEMDLYLPKSWCDDPARRAEAWIPDDVLFRTKPAIALDQVDRIRASAEVRLPVLADAGYGDDTAFRDGLRSRELPYAVGISGTLKVWRPQEGPDPPAPYAGRGRPSVTRYPGKYQPVEVRELAKELPAKAWTPVDLRPGTRNPRTSRFARIRVRHAHGAIAGHPPGPEEWLLGEWPESESGPTHYYLVSVDMPLEPMAILAKLRYRVERDYQDAKQEVGLDQYEGRRWTGFNHHLTICMASMAYLVASRALFPPRLPTHVG
jgi:SRSO17 transposase